MRASVARCYLATSSAIFCTALIIAFMLLFVVAQQSKADLESEFNNKFATKFETKSSINNINNEATIATTATNNNNNNYNYNYDNIADAAHRRPLAALQVAGLARTLAMLTARLPAGRRIARHASDNNDDIAADNDRQALARHTLAKRVLLDSASSVATMAAQSKQRRSLAQQQQQLLQRQPKYELSEPTDQSINVVVEAANTNTNTNNISNNNINVNNNNNAANSEQNVNLKPTIVYKTANNNYTFNNTYNVTNDDATSGDEQALDETKKAQRESKLSAYKSAEHWQHAMALAMLPLVWPSLKFNQQAAAAAQQQQQQQQHQLLQLESSATQAPPVVSPQLPTGELLIVDDKSAQIFVLPELSNFTSSSLMSFAAATPTAAIATTTPTITPTTTTTTTTTQFPLITDATTNNTRQIINNNNNNNNQRRRKHASNSATVNSDVDSTKLASSYRMPKIKLKQTNSSSTSATTLTPQNNFALTIMSTLKASSSGELKQSQLQLPIALSTLIASNNNKQNHINNNSRLTATNNTNNNSKAVNNSKASNNNKVKTKIKKKKKRQNKQQQKLKKQQQQHNKSSSTNVDNNNSSSNKLTTIKLFAFKRKPDADKLPFYKQPLNFSDSGELIADSAAVRNDAEVARQRVEALALLRDIPEMATSGKRKRRAKTQLDKLLAELEKKNSNNNNSQQTSASNNNNNSNDNKSNADSTKQTLNNSNNNDNNNNNNKKNEDDIIEDIDDDNNNSGDDDDNDDGVVDGDELATKHSEKSVEVALVPVLRPRGNTDATPTVLANPKLKLINASRPTSSQRLESAASAPIIRVRRKHAPLVEESVWRPVDAIEQQASIATTTNTMQQQQQQLLQLKPFNARSVEDAAVAGEAWQIVIDGEGGRLPAVADSKRTTTRSLLNKPLRPAKYSLNGYIPKPKLLTIETQQQKRNNNNNNNLVTNKNLLIPNNNNNADDDTDADEEAFARRRGAHSSIAGKLQLAATASEPLINNTPLFVGQHQHHSPQLLHHHHQQQQQQQHRSHQQLNNNNHKTRLPRAFSEQNAQSAQLEDNKRRLIAQLAVETRLANARYAMDRVTGLRMRNSIKAKLRLISP